MDWFFCIVLSIIIIRYWWKHGPRRNSSASLESYSTSANSQKRLEYEEELRKKGYSDEIIAVIVPTLMNDGGM